MFFLLRVFIFFYFSMALRFRQCGNCEKRQSNDTVLVEHTKYYYSIVVEVEGKVLVYV